MAGRRMTVVGAATAILLAGTTAPALAGNGELDPGFGVGGVVTSRLSGDDFTVDLVPTDGGALLQLVQLVSGSLGDKQPAGAAVLRYLADGRLDTGFGSGGIVRLPAALTMPAQLVATSSGMFAVGSSGLPADAQTGRGAVNGDAVLVPIGPSGSAGAPVATDLGNEQDDRISAAAAEGGRVVVAGTRLGGIAMVARLGTDGTLDPSFGAGDGSPGIVDLPADEGRGAAVSVDPAGRVLLTAPLAQGTALHRFTDGGEPDPAFATNGRRDLQLTAVGFSPVADGRVVVPGSSGGQALLQVVAADGTTTSTYRLPTSSCSPVLIGSHVDTTADGTVHVTAFGQTTADGCGGRPVLLRATLWPDGLLPDATFGENGFLDVTATQVHATAPAAVVPAGDRVVLGAATAPNGEYDGALISIQTTGAAATTLHLTATDAVTVDYYRPVRITALLARASGQPIGRRTLTLQRRGPGGDWAAVSTGATTTAGIATLSDVARLPTADYRVTFAGSDTLAAAGSETRSVTARPVLTAAISTTLLKLGQSLRISGIAGPSTPVTLQRYGGGTWTSVATAAPGSNGAYAFGLKPTTATIQRYRILKPATDQSTQAVTGQLAVNVYRMQIPTIHYNAAGSDLTNPNGEYLTLRNTGSAPVPLAGWRLDAGGVGQRFTLPAYSLGPGASVRIFTGRGTNGPGRIFLGRRYGDIWNNNGDVATLFDSKGVTAATYRY